MFIKHSIGVVFKSDRVIIVDLKLNINGKLSETMSTHRLDPESDLQQHIHRVNEILNEKIGEERRFITPELYIGIPRKLTTIRTLCLPSAAKENLRSTLSYEMEKYFPLPVSDIHFDYTIISEAKADRKLNVVLYIVKKADIEPYFELTRSIKTGVSGIEPDVAASANYMGKILKDKYGGKRLGSNFMVFKQNGHVALDLTIQNRLCDSRRFPTEEILSSESRLSEEIHHQFKSTHAILIPPFSIFCQSEFKHKLEDRQFDEMPSIPDLIDFSQLGIDEVESFAAKGLAFKGMTKYGNNINFLPPHQRKKPEKTSLFVLMVLFLLFIGLAIVWGGSYVLHQRMTSNMQRAELSRLVKDIDRIERIQAEIQLAEERIDFLNDIRLRNIPVLEILKIMSDIIPGDTWVNSFTYDQGKGVVIEGYSQQASDLLKILEASPLFTDARFISPITKEKDKERFKIGLKLN